jgi:hypothetical protein
MAKLIGYARVSTRQQSTDRQEADLLAAGVRRDDLYIDHGVSGARSSRPQFDRALDALVEGDTLVISSKRLMPFILCLAVLVKTGKTKGFQDIAAVFSSSRRRS